MVNLLQNPRRVWLLVIALAGLVLLVPLPAQAAVPQYHTIRIEASSYQYTPAEVRVSQGDTLTIELVAKDVVHGVYIDGYGLQLTADPGQTTRLTFIADRAGTFRLRCSVVCGALHPFMIGKLYVGYNGLLIRMIGMSLLIAFAAFAINPK